MEKKYYDNIFVALLVIEIILSASVKSAYWGYLFLIIDIALIYIVIRRPLRHRHLYFGILAFFYYLVSVYVGHSEVSFHLGDYVIMLIIFLLEFHFPSFEKKSKERESVSSETFYHTPQE